MRALVFEEHRGVQDRRDDAAGDRTDDPDVPVRPVTEDEGGSEPSRRVHGGARVGAERHDVERDHEADREPRRFRPGPARIDRRAEDREHEEERRVASITMPLRRRCPGRAPAPAVAGVVQSGGDQVLEQQRSRHGAEELRADQITARREGICPPPTADRDGGIHQAARDVRRDRDMIASTRRARAPAGQVESEAHRVTAPAPMKSRERRHELRYRRLARAFTTASSRPNARPDRR